VKGLERSELSGGEAMKMKPKAQWGISMLTLAILPWSLGQAAKPDEVARRGLVSSPRSALIPVAVQVVASPNPAFFREIDDPRDGARWLLSRDVQRPGGPGVLTRADRAPSPSQFPKPGARQGETAPVPVIRAGDRLILEEHSAVIDARLEAIALAPAAVGFELQARLSIEGKVVRARALAPGRAVLEPEKDGQP
jgi:hypothetical protein